MDKPAIASVKTASEGAGQGVALGKGPGLGAAIDDRDGEILSAMMDDEAQDLELRRLLRNLDSTSELRTRWDRLQMARSVMHGEACRPAVDFAASVRAAIDDEPALEVQQPGGWRRSLGSFAIAASVALVVIAGGQQLAQTAGDGTLSGSGVARVAPIPVGVVNTAGAVPMRASYGTGAVPSVPSADGTAYRELARQRLRRYSQEHAEHASLNTPQGMLPFARVPVIQEQ